MGWRSIVIANPASLSLDNGALSIVQKEHKARIMLEDISVLVLDHSQINITVPLLSACADAQIAVLTVNASHLPNGVLMPYFPHSRALKVMTAQLALSLPTRKRLWQRIVRHKLHNQASVLARAGHGDVAGKLSCLAEKVRSGDPENLESQGAQLYFRPLFDPHFHRRQERFYNAALNYGYAVLRAAIARTLAGYGFIPAVGLFHHNEQNGFNLADDLIEPYRPLVDNHVREQYPEEPDRDLQSKDKANIVLLLHQDVDIGGGRCTVLAAIEATVSALSSIVMQSAPIEQLVFPQLGAPRSADNLIFDP